MTMPRRGDNVRPPATIIRTLAVLAAIAALAAGCSKSPSKDGSTTASTAKSATTGEPSYADGDVYVGETDDGGDVRVEVGELGDRYGAKITIAYSDTCDGHDADQEATLGPFPIDDDHIEQPSDDAEKPGFASIEGEFQGGGSVTGTLQIAEYTSDKRGDCDEVDVSWEAELDEEASDGGSTDGEDDGDTAAGGDADVEVDAGDTIYESDFQDATQAASEWELANTADTYSGIVDGSLRVYARKKTLYMLPSSALADLDDTVVAATGSVGVSSEKGEQLLLAPQDGWGMGCRFDVKANSGYLFLQRVDGEAGIFRIDEGNATLLEQATVDRLESGPWVDLEIRCVEDVLQFVRDGDVIVSATDPSYTDGDVIVVSSADHVGFDLLIDEIKAEEAELA